MSITFYRDQLKTGQAKAFYDEICASISRGNVGGLFPLTIQTHRFAARDAGNAITALRKDRPDFFFVGSTSRIWTCGNQMTLMNCVLYTPEQIRQIRIHLDRALNAFTQGIAGLSTWDRERIVYERIRRYVTYADHSESEDKHKDYDHNIVGPVLQGSGVCESFSCLLTLALRKAGIPCIRVDGYGKNEAHCWNLAWIDGSSAHLDLTWDSVNEDGDVGFFYFNLTDEQITRDHKITTRGLPECLDPTNGYHYRKGLVFSTTSEASKFFKKAFADNPGAYSIRFSDECDVNSSMKKAMRQAPVMRYQYRYSDTQRTALVWGG